MTMNWPCEAITGTQRFDQTEYQLLMKYGKHNPLGCGAADERTGDRGRIVPAEM
jgi:hypothetical protein